MHGGVLFFSHFADQRLYRVDPGQAPRPITPEALALRYADLCVDARRGLLWGVREDHRAGGEPRNGLVALQAQGDAEGGRVVAEGQDFYAAPRLSPDGTQLAWLSWNHPDMPWDGCELWLAEVDDAGRLHGARRLAGSRDEAVQQPLWSPDGGCTSSATAAAGGTCTAGAKTAAEALCPMAAEFGQPMWNFGLATYAFDSARSWCAASSSNAVSRLAVLDTATKPCATIDTPFSHIGNLAAARRRACCSPARRRCRPRRCACCTWTAAASRLLRRGSTLDADPAYTLGARRRSNSPPPAA